MKKVFSVLGIFCLLALPVSGFAAEWTGVITETHCGAMHKAGTAKDIDCIKTCVKNGEGKLALLVGNDVFTITNPDKATGHEGHTVTVSGTQDAAAKTVTIETLSMA